MGREGRKVESAFLCHLSDLEQTGAFGVSRARAPREVVVCRDGDIVRAYVNACPHRGTPLELLPHHFLDASGRFLVCTVHGARFRVEDGFCVSGPCRGASMEALPVTEEKGAIFLAVEKDAPA